MGSAQATSSVAVWRYCTIPQNNEDTAPATRENVLLHVYFSNDKRMIFSQSQSSDHEHWRIFCQSNTRRNGPHVLEAFKIVHTVAAAAVQITKAPNAEAITWVWSHRNVTVQQQLVDFGKNVHSQCLTI